jgi:hypothetical protein
VGSDGRDLELQRRLKQSNQKGNDYVHLLVLKLSMLPMCAEFGKLRSGCPQTSY